MRVNATGTIASLLLQLVVSGAQASEPTAAVPRVSAPTRLAELAHSVAGSLRTSLLERGVRVVSDPPLDLPGLQLAVGCPETSVRCLDAVLRALQVDLLVGASIDVDDGDERMLVLRVRRHPAAPGLAAERSQRIAVRRAAALAPVTVAALLVALFEPERFESDQAQPPRVAAKASMPKDSAASSGPLRPAGSGPAARLAAEGQANDPRARHVGSSAAGLPAGIIALAITGGALLVGGGTMLILAKRDADSYAAHDIQTRADARSALRLRSAAETKGTLGIALLSGSGAALLWVLLFQALDSDDDTDTPDRAMTPRHAARVLPWVSGRGAGLLARAEF